MTSVLLTPAVLKPDASIVPLNVTITTLVLKTVAMLYLVATLPILATHVKQKTNVTMIIVMLISVVLTFLLSAMKMLALVLAAILKLDALKPLFLAMTTTAVPMTLVAMKLVVLIL
jgi:hypothetical protein